MPKKYTEEDSARDSREIERNFSNSLASLRTPKALGNGLTFCVIGGARYSPSFDITPGPTLDYGHAKKLAAALNRFVGAFDDRRAAYDALPDITEEA